MVRLAVCHQHDHGKMEAEVHTQPRDSSALAWGGGVWRRLQRARPREVQLQHVRSHIKVPGNELANWLADNGRMSDRKGVTEATRWMRAWMTRQRMSATGQHAGNHGAGPAQIGSPGSSGDG